jgi:hypothetical protein
MMIRCVAGIVTPNLLAPRPGPAFATPSTASGQLNEAALHHVLSGHSAATFLDASGSPRFQVPFRPSCQQTKQFQCHCSLRSTAPLQDACDPRDWLFCSFLQETEKELVVNLLTGGRQRMLPQDYLVTVLLLPLTPNLPQ